MRPLSLFAALSALVLSSCFSPGDGQAPPLESLYFPTGLVLDPAAQPAADAQVSEPAYLYVASSDFDLQYRSSSLISFSLERMRQVVPQSCSAQTEQLDCALGEHCDSEPSAANGFVPSFFCVPGDGPYAGQPCREYGPRSAADRLLNPGRCNSVDPIAPQNGELTLIRDKVGIGAFATDVISRFDEQSGKGRLFLPVRGDATVHWIDLNDGLFACDQEQTDDHSCAGSHRAGNTASANDNGIRQPSEPFAIDATEDGTYLAVTNQTAGSVSLFATKPSAWNEGPKLVTILGGLPQAPVAIATLPAPDSRLVGEDEPPGFLVAYRNAPQVDLLRVRLDQPVVGSADNYSRYALTWAGTAAINANSIGFDSRGIVIDAEQRDNDYLACQASHCPDLSEACLAAYKSCALAVHQPNIYVANRAPSSLLVGSMTADYSYRAGTNELPSFIDSVALSSGPSRVVLGHVKVPGALYHDLHGSYDLERRVFVICFDSRRVFVYDPKRRVIDSIVSTGRGPYAFTVDEARGLGYVAHFTDSYLGVISLDQRFPQTYATIVASIGNPSPPRSSK